MFKKRHSMKILWQPLLQSQGQNVFIFNFQEKIFSLEKEKCECIRSRVLTHSYRRAQLPRDPNHPLLRCLSKQKQALSLLWRFRSRIVTTHEVCFNREIYVTNTLLRSARQGKAQRSGCLGSQAEALMSSHRLSGQAGDKRKKAVSALLLQRLALRI